MAELRARREAVVREHMVGENEHRWNDVMAIEFEPEGDRLVCQRVYRDRDSITRQRRGLRGPEADGAAG